MVSQRPTSHFYTILLLLLLLVCVRASGMHNTAGGIDAFLIALNMTKLCANFEESFDNIEVDDDNAVG